ncbi:MAG: hypothetical protein WB660_19095 [Candidatus Sulfotelmatobacter sp.]
MKRHLDIGLALATTVAVQIVFFNLVPNAQGQESPLHAEQGSILDAVGLPGQMWIANGTYSPVEKNNVISQWDFQQTAVVYSGWRNSLTVTPYLELGGLIDSEGYTYDNQIQPTMGIKINKLFRIGIVSAGTAYSYEDRFSAATASGRTDFISDWFGWQSIVNPKNRFPGSSWAIVGHISPVEHGDLIEQAYATQGYVLHRFSRGAIIPYGEITLGHDSQGYDWENRYISGGGLKFGASAGELYTDFGAGLMHESRFNSGLSANGLKVFLNISYTWHLLGRKGNN